MNELTHRAYREHEYAVAVIAFLAGINSHPLFTTDFGIGDFVWSGFRDLQPSYAETAQLWELDGQIVALGWLFTPNEYAVTLDPDYYGSLVEREIFARALTWARLRLPQLELDNAEPIGTTILTTDTTAANHLTELGLLTSGALRHNGYARILTTPIPPAVLPAGFSVVTMTEGANFSDRVQAVKDVWPESELTLERYLMIRNAPVYRPDLDLCVRAPDGRFAAFLIAWLAPDSQSVQFEPIGARPEFRRMGLTRALIQEALHRAQALGANRAYINCSATGEPENALYRSAGFTLAGSWQWWHEPHPMRPEAGQ